MAPLLEFKVERLADRLLRLHLKLDPAFPMPHQLRDLVAERCGAQMVTVHRLRERRVVSVIAEPAQLDDVMDQDQWVDDLREFLSRDGAVRIDQ